MGIVPLKFIKFSYHSQVMVVTVTSTDKIHTLWLRLLVTRLMKRDRDDMQILPCALYFHQATCLDFDSSLALGIAARTGRILAAHLTTVDRRCESILEADYTSSDTVDPAYFGCGSQVRGNIKR